MEIPSPDFCLELLLQRTPIACGSFWNISQGNKFNSSKREPWSSLIDLLLLLLLYSLQPSEPWEAKVSKTQVVKFIRLWFKFTIHLTSLILKDHKKKSLSLFWKGGKVITDLNRDNWGWPRLHLNCSLPSAPAASEWIYKLWKTSSFLVLPLFLLAMA